MKTIKPSELPFSNIPDYIEFSVKRINEEEKEQYCRENLEETIMDYYGIWFLIKYRVEG